MPIAHFVLRLSTQSLLLWLAFAIPSCATWKDDTAAVALPADASVADGSPDAEAAHRGLWILCEGSQRVLEDPERIPVLIERAQAMGVTDLFVQVYRGGRAWYPTEHADVAPYLAIQAEHGVDTFARLIELAQAADLRVHAWVNVLSLNHRRGAKIVETLGEETIMVDRRGRSLLDYPSYEVPESDAPWYRMGTPGLYLDPGAPGVADWLIGAFDDLLARYEALDGVHLDYIRHPGILPFVPGSRFGVGLDFGYGDATRLEFQHDTGLRPPTPGNRLVENSARWDRWRREKMDALVAGISTTLKQRKPAIELSAAVISHADRAYLALYQNWRGWLANDTIDFAVPMAYTLDDELLGYQLEGYAGSPHSERIWAGLGTWLFSKSPDRALEQVGIAQRAPLGGYALFSYDSIADAPALLEALTRDEVAPVSSSPQSP